VNKPALVLTLAALLAPLAPSPAGARLQAAPAPQASAQPATEQIVLAGGCYWGMEAVFGALRGVTKVMSGYSGGGAATANYQMVESGSTGHAESVEITFDPSVISLRQLIDVDFTIAMDPTEENYQGPDHGSQYRSVVFYENADQEAIVNKRIAYYASIHLFHAPIVTQVVPLKAFYPAEPEMRNYVATHRYDSYVVQEDLPKLAALHKIYPNLLASH